jgi:hypothetical protein
MNSEAIEIASSGVSVVLPAIHLAMKIFQHHIYRFDIKRKYGCSVFTLETSMLDESIGFPKSAAFQLGSQRCPSRWKFNVSSPRTAA